MRIAIIANSSTGLFNFRQELIQQLKEKNNEVIAITPDNGKIDELKEIGCRIVEVPVDRRGMNPIKDFSVLCQYIRLLKREKPDLVVTYTIKPNIYGGIACRVLNIPYAGNITGLGTAFQNNGILKRMVVFLYKKAFKKVKTVFFENVENRDIFVKEGIVSQTKTCVLAGAGVNLDRFILEDYPIGGTIKFLFMGRVMQEKGINELFRAMKMLVDDNLNVHLDVLGGYEEEYQSIIKEGEEQGWLTYHGYQSDVKPFIKESHCFVLPSWHEGMANTNLESAAMGRPIITSNIHGCLEAVIDGKSGYLAERKNADDLYRAMKKFVQLSHDKRKMMGIEGRKHMEEQFDKNKVVSITVDELLK